MGLLTDLGRGALGMAFLLGICWLLSNNRRAINWRLVGTGLILQIGLALAVMHVEVFRMGFEWVAKVFVKIISLGHEGTRFMFGALADDRGTEWGYVFAIQVLPNIIFFSAISALLYYLGVLQKIVYGFAWVMSKTMKISGAESVSTAANIFLGQTEAPLMVRPYLAGMTRSEILCIMVGGMANTAGSVLAAYVGFLGGSDEASRQFFALHLLTQSVMSAPAAIICAKMLYPEAEQDRISRDLNVPKENLGSNILDAISIGTTDGVKLAVNVAAMLVVFTAVMAALNYILFKVGDWSMLNQGIVAATNGAYQGLNLQLIFGYVFAPIAWLIGVPQADVLPVGQLLGEKTIINEFIAYKSLGNMQAEGVIKDPKSILISTYALCGFANFASIGIQIGGIGMLAPNQRRNLTELGIKSLIGGTIACLMVACIAGMLH